MHASSCCLTAATVQVQDLDHLVASMAHEGAFSARFQSLARGLCEVCQPLYHRRPGWAHLNDLSHVPQAAHCRLTGCSIAQLGYLALQQTLSRCQYMCCAQVVQDFGLVSFMPLAIEDMDSVQAAIAATDKATGYVFKGLQQHELYPELAYTARQQPLPELHSMEQQTAHGLGPRPLTENVKEH